MREERDSYAKGSMFAGIGVISSSSASLNPETAGHLLRHTLAHFPELFMENLTLVVAVRGQRFVVQPLVQEIYADLHELRHFLMSPSLEILRTHLQNLPLRMADKKAIHLHLP